MLQIRSDSYMYAGKYACSGGVLTISLAGTGSYVVCTRVPTNLPVRPHVQLEVAYDLVGYLVLRSVPNNRHQCDSNEERGGLYSRLARYLHYQPAMKTSQSAAVTDAE